MRVGTLLDAQRADQAVVHQAGKLADGGVGALRRFAVDSEGVREDRERDVCRWNETSGRRRHARERGLNGWVGRRVE